MHKKVQGVGVGGGSGLGGGGSGWISGGGVESGRGVRVGVDEEGRSEVFVKIKKNVFGFSGLGWSGWGVRVDVNEELKFCEIFCENSKKIVGGWGGVGCE